MIKKRKSFEQRGEMAASAWAEQQMRELNLKARRAARDKVPRHSHVVYLTMRNLAD